MNKNFDITNTLDAKELSKRWGVTKKTIDNRRYRGQGPNYFKIGGAIRYDLEDVRRIENKSYGVCRVTGKLISKERLKLVPHATLSIEAKKMQR